MKLSRHPARMILTLILVPMLFMLADTANAAGQGYRTIYRFQGSSDGWLPLGVPAADKNGNLYGVTGDGGAYKLGTVYKLTAPQTRGGKWTKTVLYNFASNEGGYPGSVVLGQDGNLYGHAFSRNIFELTPPTSRDGAWKYALLYTLNPNDGGSIAGSLVFDAAGNLYGAAELGGDLNCGNSAGCGTVFELKRPTTKGGKWHFNVLHTFTGTPDGAQPFAGVTFDRGGNLYGTTWEGGSYGWGAVYRVSPPKKKGQGWTETVLYSFDTGNYDIITPEGPVAFDTSGNLYGTTPLGGDLNCQGGYGCGVVFELAPPSEGDGSWTYATLYAFQGGNDGIAPQGYMVFDPTGNLYSTTGEGGGGTGYSGIAFRLTQAMQLGAAWGETVLHRFQADAGGGPNEGLTWGKWGNLYGVTLGGGPSYYGTVFEVRP